MGEREPQDWRVLLLLLCFGALFDITAWGHLQAFTPLFLEQELQMDPTQVPFWTGVLAALPLCVAVPLAPLWGVLADRYSRKLIILRSLAIESVAYGLAAFSHTMVIFVLVRLLLGLAFGNVALMVASLSLATPERRLGTAVGLFATMSRQPNHELAKRRIHSLLRASMSAPLAPSRRPPAPAERAAST